MRSPGPGTCAGSAWGCSPGPGALIIYLHVQHPRIPTSRVYDGYPSSPRRVTACDLVLEYTLSAAAVAKGFTAYTAALIGVPVHYLRLEVGHGPARCGNAARMRACVAGRAVCYVAG